MAIIRIKEQQRLEKVRKGFEDFDLADRTVNLLGASTTGNPKIDAQKKLFEMFGLSA